jgi:hypothetical protein
MIVQQLINTLKSAPDTITFEQVMETITENYDYNPSDFSNGIGDSQVSNAAGTNEGSCKIFAFGLLNDLTETETLACFGKYYREDVLNNPQGEDHANIRNFIKSGWAGIHFDQPALAHK